MAFGAHVAKTGVVSDAMLTAAAEALPLLLTEQHLKDGRVYPDLNNIRWLPENASWVWVGGWG